MKNTLLTLLLLTVTTILPGQVGETPYTQQFGFDAGGFLARFFNFSGTGTGESPYYLTYRKLGEKKNTRLGLGANFSVEGGNNSGTNSQNSINFRAGSERFTDFGKRWRAFYGWDFKFLFTHFSAGGGGNNATQLGLGVAPLFGLQWRLNDRLSFSTELAYNLFLTVRDSNGRTRYGANTSFSPPVAWYVNYDF